MARWDPDARGRLLRAAIELFTEQGYETTTTAQIAQRAGLTRTTLFRLFSDKREILFQGQGALIAGATEAIHRAPADASAGEVLTAGVTGLAGVHTAEQRETGRLLAPLMASSPELQERAAFKRDTIARAIEHELSERFEDRRLAGVLADIGVRSYYAGYASWIASPDDLPLTLLVQQELAEHSAALRQILVE
ncbi:TetR/AcrR family transcriptional regulator [Actinoplanes sp. DH11]|uniref:TetR/AcrR family transcriptional regulator n=1 Tax=Actinoplanes sp. DH11 TaxID=2857011 RepID=UPI001E432252|nr:TetR/AcrR family transcriptional regulator [Actinoplanes sp. DH11]